MKRSISFSLLGILILAGFIAISQSAPKSPDTSKPPAGFERPALPTDTVPPKNKRIQDLDEALRDIERALEKLDIELKKPVPPVPPIEMNKVKAEIERALKDVDPDKIKKEIEMAMKEIGGEKLKSQIEASLAKVDMEKVKKDLERFREIELPKIEEEMKKIGPEIERSLQEAKKSVENAKKEIEEYKAFENDLEKDGLINKKGNYTIEHKNGILTINGKTQPPAVYNKYKAFLDKHKNFTWKKDRDGININND